MQRFFLVLTVLSVFSVTQQIEAQSTWTIDGGGSLDSETGPLPVWQSGRIYMTDRIDAHLQLRQTSERLRVDYDLAGYFRYTSEREVSADLTQLGAELTLRGFPGARGSFHARLGRIPIADPSGFVFREPGDGVSVGMAFPRLSVALTAAYLGLLLKDTNEALATAADRAALSDPSIILAPQRGVGLFTLSFPELVYRSDLNLWSMYLTGFGANLTEAWWYAGLSTRGPLWGPLSERVDLIAGGGIANRLSLFMRTALLADFPRALESHAEVEALYSSGETSRLAAFLPLTGDTAGVVLATTYQNLIRLSALCSFRPMANSTMEWFRAFAPFLASRWYFRQSPVPVSPVGYDPAGNYYGTELEGGVEYRHGTDPDLSLSGGFFADASARLQWFGKVSFLMRF